jgi:hypothetical protein
MAVTLFVVYITPGYFYNDMAGHGDELQDALVGTCRTVKLDGTPI